MNSKQKSNSNCLNKQTLRSAADFLCKKDKDLLFIIDQYGYPPLWVRPANFSTLVQIILEQQVSLASAKATFSKLKKSVAGITPEHFVNLSFAGLNGLGFSRQKADYCLGLAQGIINKDFSLEKIAKLETDAARNALTNIRGIGLWSADIYLLMALRRPDIWPKGDLALDAAVYEIKRLRKKPTIEHIEKIVSAWRPWRSVAARILWHFYLSR